MKLHQIITSLLETDLYKFSMGQAIYHQYPSYKTRREDPDRRNHPYGRESSQYGGAYRRIGPAERPSGRCGDLGLHQRICAAENKGGEGIRRLHGITDT